MNNTIRCSLCNIPSGQKYITMHKIKGVYYCDGCYKFLLKNNFKLKEEEKENG